jgi:hypothetical protein
VFRNLTVRATGKSRRGSSLGSLRSFEIMASGGAGGLSSGGSPDDVANQNAGKKNARQIESW